MKDPEWLEATTRSWRAPWREGRDARTGRAVRIADPDEGLTNDPTPESPFERQGWFGAPVERRAEIRRRQAAEAVRTFTSPSFLRVLSIEPLIVETPTPLVGELTPDEALECLLQLCEAVAELHAAGWAHRRLTPNQIGIDRSGATPRVELSFPSIGPRWLAEDDRAATVIGAIRCDVLQIARLASIWVGSIEGTTSSDRVERIVRDVESVADLARAIAAARPDDGWRARAARMPDTRALVPVPTDWDRVISSLDEDMRVVAARQWAEYSLPRYAYALAAALDQRARLALARGDLAAALTDAERAVSIDDDPPYRVTCAVVRLELGDVDAALAHVDRAFSPPPRLRDDDGVFDLLLGPPPTTLSGPMLARAHLVRARAHQIRGDREAAGAELALARAASEERIIDSFTRV